MTNRYIGLSQLTAGEQRCDVHVLFLPMKVNPNHFDAISKVADRSHFPKLLKTDRKTYKHRESMNEFSVTVTDSLGIIENFIDENPTDQVTDPVEKTVKKFSNHPSILKIKGHHQNAGPFGFQKVAPGTVDKEVKNLNPKKATTHKNIPPKILKSNSDVCVEPFTNLIDCIENSTFPDELKCADVTPLPKNGPTNTRTNFRPISVLPTVSQLFERIMDKQIVAYITTFLSSLLCGFRKVTVHNMLL